MHHRLETSYAELSDRLVQTTALALFVVSIMFALAVVEYFVPSETATVLDWVGMGLGLVIVALIGTSYFRYCRRMKPVERSHCFAEDGFLQTAFRLAMSRSWMIVFVVLALLQALDNMVLSRLPEMPTDVVLQAVLALMLMIFSVMFGFAVWGGGADEAVDHFGDVEDRQ